MDKIRYILTSSDEHEQRIKAMEEAAELIQAISKIDSNKTYKTLENLISEIADVTIMMEQLLYMYNITEDRLLEEVNYKIDRQIQRIKSKEV